MSRVKANIKPEILTWARETAGLSVDEAAKKIGVKKPDRLAQWEKGEDKPTINQLRNLAKAYKRPLSVFYLQDVPQRFQVMKDFRRLPGMVALQYSPELLLEIRNAQERRQLAFELFEETGEKPTEFSLYATLDDDPEKIGPKIRKALNISYAEQTRWRDERAGFNAWRANIESLGALVFQATRVDMEEMRGFSIAEPLIPVIAVNRKDALTGRTFSLLHEFAHLMLRSSGLCDLDEEAQRAPEEQRVEVFCNQIAAATLMPKERFLTEDIVLAQDSSVFDWSDDDLSEMSKRYSVSREAVLRRLLTFGKTTDSFYRKKRAQFLKEYKSRRERERENLKNQDFRRNPSNEAISAYGKAFIRLVFNTYYQDRITLSDVSGYLGVRVRHIPTIEQAISAR
ncbi:MAG: ImmA/IrrE family metallo-endopeptidase [Chromatiaceae bacterium]|nr:ImmA/IrrE family metallo-endopeptidase [Chromatiaceae bacterium]